MDSENELSLDREKLAALKQFAYGLSHEINNPLTNIAMRAQTLLIGETDPARRKALETINAQAFRAFEMIADLMLFAHPPAPVPTTFNPRELLVEVVQQFSAAAKEQETQLALSAINATKEVTADRAQIAVALGALIKNALEAVRSGGEVVVDALPGQENGPEMIEFTVRDNGPGISAEIRRHLFDPFFSGREAGRGLGLGLCKAWRIAELHGGEIVVESQPGAGTRFGLRVPVMPDSPPADLKVRGHRISAKDD